MVVVAHATRPSPYSCARVFSVTLAKSRFQRLEQLPSFRGSSSKEVSHHTSQERQPAAVQELPDDQPHQSPKQSHTEDHTEQIEATSGEDHR